MQDKNSSNISKKEMAQAGGGKARRRRGASMGIERRRQAWRRAPAEQRARAATTRRGHAQRGTAKGVTAPDTWQ